MTNTLAMTFLSSGEGPSNQNKEFQPSRETIQEANAWNRSQRTHIENWWHDTVEPINIIRQAFRKDNPQFWLEMKNAANFAFNPFPRGEDGNRHFNPRALVYWGLVALAASCLPKVKGHSASSNPGGSDNNSDTTAADLCNNLVRIAAASSVDMAVGPQAWIGASDSNHADLEKQLDDCGSPDGSVEINQLLIAAVLPGTAANGDEVMLMDLVHAGNQPEDVSHTSLLAISVGQIDDNADGQADYELIKYVETKPTMG